MGNSPALSNRQRKQVRKAVVVKPRLKAVLVRGAEPAAAEPTGMAARVAVQERVVQVEMSRVGVDLALAVALGNITPGMAAEEFGVETRSTDHVVSNAQGKVRWQTAVGVRGRDGLLALHATGALTDDQAKAGLAYRLCYETAAKGLGSSLGSIGEGRVARDWTELKVGVDENGDLYRRASVLDLQRSYVRVRLNQMELAVGAVIADGRELHALRLIAGEGQTVREVAGASGHARTAYARALARALDAIARVLRIAGQ